MGSALRDYGGGPALLPKLGRNLIGAANLSVTAFILAGGKSARMGQDKAFVLWDGRTLLERALAIAGEVTPTVRIVGQHAKLGRFGTVVEDVFLDRGPLGGIHAALCSTETEFNLVLGVDLPLVRGALLEYLLERAQGTEAMVTAPRFTEGWQPLCAVYRKSFVEIAEEALRGERNAIYPLLEAGSTLALNESDLEEAGFPRKMFRNINTVEDLAAL